MHVPGWKVGSLTQAVLHAIEGKMMEAKKDVRYRLIIKMKLRASTMK
jgi:hypothetical protein